MKSLVQIFFFSLFLFSISNAQIVVLDDFEAGVGRFNTQTTYSGSTTGILGSIPAIDSSTAAIGTKSLKVVLIDDPVSTTDWHVRLLSGTGSPANNATLDSVGWFGFWLKTNKTYLKVGVSVDAPPAPLGTEKSDSLVVMGDNLWHLYQWNFGDTTQWNPWAGAGTNGKLEKPVSLDAIFFYATNDNAQNDTAVVYLDHVMFNPTGQVPVELVSFNASVDKNIVDLRWITVTELNNKGFEVQRRTNNSSYETIAFVQGKGTTTQVNGYTYSDVVNETGTYFYRLRQVDFDGTYEYSNEVMVNVLALPGEYALAQNYPNPFNPSTSIEFVLAQAGSVNLSVFNLLGEKVAELVNEVKDSGNHTLTFNANELSSGTYIYRLSVNGNVISKKMTLVK